MQKGNLSAIAAVLAMSGLTVRMASSPARQEIKGMIGAADLENINKAAEKRQRKVAKRLRDSQQAKPQ